MSEAKSIVNHADASSAPKKLEAEDYHILLERLLGKGQCYGKTKPVAAYLLRDFSIVTEKEDHDQSETVKVEPRYLVMDLDEWPNEYGRKLVVRDIMVKYAQRVVDERDLNSADFKGPGIWTTKQKSFEGDYNRQSWNRDEYGHVLHLYEPNTEAHRLCLQMDEAVSIPTAWGEDWTIPAGGTLAIREKDVTALSKALMDVRNGLKTPKEALFHEPSDGSGLRKTRFDIYGMMPGFLASNYNLVSPKKETVQAQKRIVKNNAVLKV